MTKRIEVVHDREHAFLHFSAVPGIQDDLHLFFKVEDDGGFTVQSELFVVFNLGFAGG